MRWGNHKEFSILQKCIISFFSLLYMQGRQRLSFKGRERNDRLETEKKGKQADKIGISSSRLYERDADKRERERETGCLRKETEEFPWEGERVNHIKRERRDRKILDCSPLFHPVQSAYPTFHEGTFHDSLHHFLLSRWVGRQVEP